MGKFKVGDRVECLDSYAGQFTKGKIYVVSADHLGNKYESVKVERDDGGSTENGWLPEFFKLVPTITIEPGKHYRLSNGKVTGRVSQGDIGFEALVDGHLKVFDKAGGAVFGGEDIVEAWVPKVGERVKYKVERYGEATVVEIVDEKHVKVDTHGPFRICTEHLSDLEPLLVAAPAQPAATLKIEAGKFYRTRDGRKVGPMHLYYDDGSCFGSNGTFTGGLWKPDGSAWFDGAGDSPVLAALWQDEPAVAPAVAASNDNAPAEPKFKVGDSVRLGSWLPGYYEVTKIEGEHFWIKASGLGDLKYRIDKGDWIVLPAAVNTPTAIVALIENGVPKPAERPFVHATEAAASKEAARLAAKHKGQQFGVYVLASTAKEEAPTYKHEWQRLAANGEKINAIRELRAVTGMQLKPAKDVVEHFIDYPYGALAA